jgi:hypothetical protein
MGPVTPYPQSSGMAPNNNRPYSNNNNLPNNNMMMNRQPSVGNSTNSNMMSNSSGGPVNSRMPMNNQPNGFQNNNNNMRNTGSNMPQSGGNFNNPMNNSMSNGPNSMPMRPNGNMYNNGNNSNNGNGYNNQRLGSGGMGMSGGNGMPGPINNNARPPYQSNATPGMAGPSNMRGNMNMNMPQQPNALLNNPTRMPTNVSGVVGANMVNGYPNQNGVMPNQMLMNQARPAGNQGMGMGMAPQQAGVVSGAAGYNSYGMQNGMANPVGMPNGLLPQPVGGQYGQGAGYGMQPMAGNTPGVYGQNQALLSQANSGMVPGKQAPVGMPQMNTMMGGQQQQQLPQGYMKQDAYGYSMQQQQQQQQQSGMMMPVVQSQQMMGKLSDAEYAEILEKNRIISGSAISRAVQDASNGKLSFHYNLSSF